MFQDKRLVNDPRVVATGRDAVADCGAIVQRRLIDAEGASQRTLPLKSAWGCGARLSDLAQMIDGHVDLDRVLKLSRALMAMDWPLWNDRYRDFLPKSPPSNKHEHPDEVWLALRLACLPWPVTDGLDIRAESGVVRRLISGDASAAVQIAIRRLQASGLRVPFQAAIADADTARLWAAALAFPISRFSAKRAVEILVPQYFGESSCLTFLLSTTPTGCCSPYHCNRFKVTDFSRPGSPTLVRRTYQTQGGAKASCRKCPEHGKPAGNCLLGWGG